MELHGVPAYSIKTAATKTASNHIPVAAVRRSGPTEGDFKVTLNLVPCTFTLLWKPCDVKNKRTIPKHYYFIFQRDTLLIYGNSNQ
jgi:hypothetical protein